jgi:hypothetical protein
VPFPPSPGFGEAGSPAPVSEAGHLEAALLAARNPDGGWGYRAGKQSRIEPTSFALLALAAGGSPVDAGVLARWPRESELLIDPAATHPNIAFNAIAAVAAEYAPLAIPKVAARIVATLLEHRGAELPRTEGIALDPTLQGWPWMGGTFSWVEPTSWCLLALKRWTRVRPSLAVSARIDQAERLLRDRVCRQGGWNYGNSQVLGQALEPYAATSAVGLLALQNAPDDPIVRRSCVSLRTLCATEQSGFALALSALAFRLLGEDSQDVDRALATLWEGTRFTGEIVATALALYVVNGASDRYEAFRV